jgi:glycerol-3-phosphate acyltransferase PlsY
MTALLAFAAYLLGSISFAVVASRAFGLADPRTYGSGNPGATNVLRSGNKTAAVVTLLGDALKGWVAVWLAQRFAEPGMTDTTVALAGALAVIGHMCPVFHGFKGGKGVATALGVLFGFSVYLGLGAISTWLVIAFFFRISSLAAVIAAAFAPFATWMLFGVVHPYFFAVCVVAVLLVMRHHENIRKILNGTESRIAQKKPPAEAG